MYINARGGITGFYLELIINRKKILNYNNLLLT